MPKIKDLTGRTFFRLTAVRMVGQDARGAIWLFRCECGNEIERRGKDVVAGHPKSCGCLKRETSAANGRLTITHGACSHPLFVIWNDMRRRCNHPGDPAYKNYGGRGIKICERWNDPWKFFEDMAGRPDGAMIERIDNNKGYSPENCRWATRIEQARNCRSNRSIEFNGQTKLLCEWAEETGINEGAIRNRIDVLGWSIEEALTTPICPDYRRRGMAAHR